MSLKLISLTGFFLLYFLCIDADVYMHSPRGSNNRLNENSANRRTNNRAFDSQNNNRGGYNVGDRTDNAAGNNAANQYQMVYFQSSKLSKTGKGISNMAVEWTNQHGCGGNEDDNPNKLNCNLVFQFMCEPNVDADDRVKMRDGTSTNRQDYTAPQNGESETSFKNRKNSRARADRVYQEPYEWYDKCNERERNKGLFTADQKVGDRAKNTRQNPNGNRNGYECPEERDYYPYWHPSDWKDIGVLAENASMCNYIETESYNVKSKFECVENFRNTDTPRHYSRHNNKAACESNNGKWKEFHNFLEKAPSFTSKSTCEAQNNAENNKLKVKYIWGLPIYGTTEQCLVALDKPFCRQSPFSRVNHLGNGDDLEANSINWELPHFPSNIEQRCVLRIRYNISTDDYAPYSTDSTQNNNPKTGVKSPVTQNPTVDIGAQNVGLKLAINTAQFGRTFQDRTHLFMLKPRATTTGNEIGDTANIHNLNVRGKRGNIVQVYPAVEYDFFPTNLKIKEDDLVHMQWTGSNTHNNGNPAGDGQAGDDGEGKRGSDRSNILGMNARGQNYPLTMEDPTSIFNNVKAVKYQAAGSHLKGTLNAEKKLDIAVQMASSGYFHCIKASTCQGNSIESKSAMQNQLNNSPASFGGMVLQFNPGTFNYTCTRNNNFSNRSQKGSLIVKN